MTEAFALLSRTLTSLPDNQMRKLAPGATVTSETTEEGLTYTYAWPDNLTIVCTVMPSEKFPLHLREMAAYVSQIQNNEPNERGEALIERINQTKLVLTVEFRPERDPQGRAEDVMGRLCDGLQPLVFYWKTIYDAQFRLLLAPDGSFDSATTPEVESNTDAHDWTPISQMATVAQIARAGRSKAILKRKAVPIFNGPLYAEDDFVVQLQPAAEVARRVLVMWAVEQRAEGLDKAKAVQFLKNAGLFDAITPKERQFLQAIKPTPAECQKYVWRLECMWVLLWALGQIETLDWPGDCCDIERLDARMGPLAADSDFVATAALRPSKEILDHLDLTLRLHWAIRNEYLNRRLIPPELDWTQPERVELNECRSVGVVEERHYAFNWLTKQGADWDDVDTPT